MLIMIQIIIIHANLWEKKKHDTKEEATGHDVKV